MSSAPVDRPKARGLSGVWPGDGKDPSPRRTHALTGAVCHPILSAGAGAQERKGGQDGDSHRRSPGVFSRLPRRSPEEGQPARPLSNATCATYASTQEGNAAICITCQASAVSQLLQRQSTAPCWLLLHFGTMDSLVLAVLQVAPCCWYLRLGWVMLAFFFAIPKIEPLTMQTHT